MMMQKLNRVFWPTAANMNAELSKDADKIVYFGVININENSKTIGAIDIWRSVISKRLFCEEKRLGILDISDHIGMPSIDMDKKWAVAVSRRRTGKDRWNLIKIIRDGSFKFTDTASETSIEVLVTDYKIIDTEWWSFLVESNVNRNMEVSQETKIKR
jgi:hypothetical protein